MNPIYYNDNMKKEISMIIWRENHPTIKRINTKIVRKFNQNSKKLRIKEKEVSLSFLIRYFFHEIAKFFNAIFGYHIWAKGEEPIVK